jgi:hypothetical protein
MRLALLLLRALQLYMCSLGSPPTLYIQVKVNSNLETYLKNLGFKIYNISDNLKEKCLQESAVWFFDDKEYVNLKIATIVKPEEVLSDSVGEVVEYSPGYFMEEHILEKSPKDVIYPGLDLLFYFPFSVSGNFVDHASSNMIYRVILFSIITIRNSSAAMNHGKFISMEVKSLN